MTAPPINFYADFKGLASLKKDATEKDPQALREAARQFESLFTQMMLKSMRDAGRSLRSKDSLMESDQTDFYSDMFDSQLSTQMTKGKGVGLAEMLVKQLRGVAEVAPKSAKIGTRDSGLETRMKPLALNVIGVNHQASTNEMSPTPQSLPRSTGDGRVGTFARQAVVDDVVSSQSVSDPSDLSRLMLQVSRVRATESAGSLVLPHETEQGKEIIDSISSSTRLDPSLSSPESRVPSLELIGPTVGIRESVATSPREFITQLWPHAKAAAAELGVDPHMLIAHAALETGWGKSVPGNPDGTCSFNLFGIKAGSKWQGPAVGVNTLEFEDGIAVRRRASFRAYESPADSFRDYASLIKSSPRYAAALGKGGDAAAFAKALQQGGYATDPNYADKLTAIAEGLRASLKTQPPQPLALGRRVSIGGQT